jgi:hypothetical protein
LSSSAIGDGEASSSEDVAASGIAVVVVVAVVVRSTAPLRGVDRILVRLVIGVVFLRLETGDFDPVGVRTEVCFVGRFDGVVKSIISSSSDTIAARGVVL